MLVVEKFRQVATKDLLMSSMKVIIGTLTLGMSHFVYIPVSPIPITSQTLVVLLIGAFLGRKLAVISVVLFATLGFAGLPFLTGKGFITFGYIIGFIFAVYVIGYFKEKGYMKSFKSSFLVMALAHQSIFVFGIAVIYYILGDFSQAFAVGYLPFIGFDFMKITMATSIFALTLRKSQ